MEGYERSPSICLELTMAVPGFSASSGFTQRRRRSCVDENGGSGYNIRDLDMNQPACGMEEEFPMGTVEDDEDAANPRPRKLRLTKEQSRLLEESFRQNQTLNPKQKEALAFKLKLKPRQVEVWFQNRRARTKLKQTEVECEYLRRCFGSLTEENRRLQREVEELRALRVAPPTVLTMCHRCERVTASGAAAATSASGAHGQRKDDARPFTRAPNPFRQPSAAC